MAYCLCVGASCGLCTHRTAAVTSHALVAGLPTAPPTAAKPPPPRRPLQVLRPHRVWVCGGLPPGLCPHPTLRLLPEAVTALPRASRGWCKRRAGGSPRPRWLPTSAAAATAVAQRAPAPAPLPPCVSRLSPREKHSHTRPVVRYVRNGALLRQRARATFLCAHPSIRKTPLCATPTCQPPHPPNMTILSLLNVSLVPAHILSPPPHPCRALLDTAAQRCVPLLSHPSRLASPAETSALGRPRVVMLFRRPVQPVHNSRPGPNWRYYSTTRARYLHAWRLFTYVVLARAAPLSACRPAPQSANAGSFRR